MDELKKRGSIAFFSTYRPPVPLDIFSWSEKGESPLTDGKSYNYNGQAIPQEALKKLIKRPKLTSQGTKEDVKPGHLTGMIFVSERDDYLETLHIGLRVDDNPPEVFSLADVFGDSVFGGVRMEDSGCIAGDFLIYVTTKDPALYRREPWTSVYKTNLVTGETSRLTPPGNADLSPSVSRSGKQIAVASFQAKAGWQGEIEDLQTDIFVMNVEKPFKRRLIVENGGWPTWGISENIIFFHRKKDKEIFGEGVEEFWGVYRVDISTGDVKRMTPVNFKSMTPAAINDTTVAVATIREKSDFADERKVDQYRHIEIFDTTRGPEESTRITQNTTPDADHFNPFVIKGSEIIGYHRCKKLIQTRYDTLKSPLSDVELFRVSGVFPTFKKDGSKLAYVDNEFKTVWVADKDRVYAVHTESSPNKVFSPVWNQNSEKDTLYFCVGHSFAADEAVQIRHIHLSTNKKKRLTSSVNKFNNAFPSTNSEGDKFVFRSKRENGFKNLWIMENAEEGESGGNVATRLTEGEWTDTHCQWSPHGEWIVFSSTRDKPKGVPDLDFGLDPGYFGVYIVHSKTKAWLRVAASGYDFSGHINHPFFSPDEKSILVASDLAAVSIDPISLPLFSHSVRPYGDIFTIDINDLKDINLEDVDENNHITDARFENVKKFTRVTHSRFENSTATWTERPPGDSKAEWHMRLRNGEESIPGPTCPFLHQGGGGHTWHTSGHLVFKDRCC
ncbi:hypothetical protein ACHQM5_005819 [Ranunculus cassubicifolius]